jgi:hypothetical protein
MSVLNGDTKENIEVKERGMDEYLQDFCGLNSQKSSLVII